MSCFKWRCTWRVCFGVACACCDSAGTRTAPGRLQNFKSLRPTSTSTFDDDALRSREFIGFVALPPTHLSLCASRIARCPCSRSLSSSPLVFRLLPNHLASIRRDADARHKGKVHEAPLEDFLKSDSNDSDFDEASTRVRPSRPKSHSKKSKSKKSSRPQAPPPNEPENTTPLLRRLR